MYTYDSFVTAGSFTLLRPILVTFLIVSVILFVFLVVPKLRHLINGFTAISISTLSIFGSAQVLFFDGIIVDELGLGGDPTSMYLFLTIVVISILNLFYYSWTKEKFL